VTGVGSVKAKLTRRALYTPRFVMTASGKPVVWDHTIDSIPADISLMLKICDRTAWAAFLAAIFAFFAMVVSVSPAGAQNGGAGKLDALYTATLAGIPIGKGAWMIDIGEDQYTAAVSGVTTGLLRVFTSGEGSGIARGAVVNSGLVPATYAASITAEKKSEELHMTFANGVVKEWSVEPPPPPHPERIPITEAHRRGVTDPMSASVMKIPAGANMLGPDACAPRTTPVFDGRLRYDLSVAFKRMETVKAEKGYAGPVPVCSVYFKPIAGYLPNRPAVKYLTEQRDMEVWLAPIAGTRFMVPFRVAVPTPLGTGALQATQFVTQAALPRATPTSLRGQ
jgi:hypothetical protein